MTEPRLFQALKESLIAAGRGPFFPDWEFATLLGFERAEILAIADSFTAATPIRGEVLRALNSSLVNLLGYPHGKDSVWRQWLSFSPDQLQAVLTGLQKHGAEA